MKRMRIHYLQHVAFEAPGYIRHWATEQGHILTHTHFFTTDHTLPNPNDIDMLIVLGGPMSVMDDYAYPWLREEKIFIEDCIQANKPVLGICLGAQLIACCLGARVFTASNKEIGWYPVTPTPECQTVPWFHTLFADSPTVFHWHGEKFDIPYNGSISLLSSSANTNQAFLYNDRVLALQFHLEVEADNVFTMLTHCATDLSTTPFVQTEEHVRKGITHTIQTHVILKSILTRLSSLV